MNALRLHDASLVFQFLLPPQHLLHNRIDGRAARFGPHDVVRFGIDGQALVLLLHGAEQRIDLRQRLDLVAPEFDAVGVVVVRGIDLDHVAAHAEGAALEVGVGALVENLHQLAGDVLALDLLSLFEEQQHAVVGFRRAQAVDAAYRGDDDAVAALEQRPGGGEPQLVQLVVDRRFLFDVNVARRNVGFRLIVVVVGDEIFNRVVGEEALELVIKLRRQRLVVRHHQRRALRFLDHLGHGKRLAGAGDAEQHLVLFALAQPARKLLDGRSLIALRLVVAVNLQFHLAAVPTPHKSPHSSQEAAAGSA